MPKNYLKNIFFYGQSNWFKSAKFFQFLAFETKNFHFPPKKQAPTAKISVTMIQLRKIHRNLFFESVGIF